uniref:Putative secreted protein n=1 Tax=Anopheles darlingi TaxID=43151 RepID=A0A2M4D907_ANODA
MQVTIAIGHQLPVALESLLFIGNVLLADLLVRNMLQTDLLVRNVLYTASTFLQRECRGNSHAKEQNCQYLHPGFDCFQ